MSDCNGKLLARPLTAAYLVHNYSHICINDFNVARNVPESHSILNYQQNSSIAVSTAVFPQKLSQTEQLSINIFSKKKKKSETCIFYLYSNRPSSRSHWQSCVCDFNLCPQSFLERLARRQQNTISSDVIITRAATLKGWNSTGNFNNAIIPSPLAKEVSFFIILIHKTLI